MATHREPSSHEASPVGPNILRIRHLLGITQKQLAEPEFSISYVSAIERGRIRPSLKALEILARRLGVSSAELLAESLEDIKPENKYHLHAEPSQHRSLLDLLIQRQPPYRAPLVLCWVPVTLAQRDYQLTRKLLDLITPN